MLRSPCWALDTKGSEYAFVRECLQRRGFRTLVIDVGVLGHPAIIPDVSRERWLWQLAKMSSSSSQLAIEAGRWLR